MEDSTSQSDDSTSESDDDLSIESDSQTMFPTLAYNPWKVDGLSHIVGCSQRAKQLRKKLKDLRKKS